jgi:hypothetical protein
LQVSSDAESISIVITAVTRLKDTVTAADDQGLHTFKSALLEQIANRFGSIFTDKYVFNLRKTAPRPLTQTILAGDRLGQSIQGSRWIEQTRTV